MQERKEEIKEIIGDLMGLPEGNFFRYIYSVKYREYCAQIDSCEREVQLEIKFNTIKNQIFAELEEVN